MPVPTCTIVANTLLNLGDVMPRYQQYLFSKSTSKDTMRWLLTDAEQFLLDLESRRVAIEDITVDAVVLYRDNLVDRKYPFGTVYRPSTARRKMTSVKRLVTFLFDNAIVWDKNLLSSELYSVPTAGQKQPNAILSIKEVKRVISLPGLKDAKGVRDTLLLFLMLFRACSVHNLVLLRLDNVDVNTGVVTVIERSDTQRTFQLSVGGLHLYKLWRSYRRMHAYDEQAVFVSLHSTNGRNQPGSMLSERGIRQVIDHYLISGGVKTPRVSCQSLRDTCIALGLEKGFCENELLSDVLPFFERKKT